MDLKIKIEVIQLLFVEHDYMDTIVVQRTLKKMNMVFNIDLAKNGEEAIAFLKSN